MRDRGHRGSGRSCSPPGTTLLDRRIEVPPRARTQPGEEMVTQVLPSWNQVREWLLELDDLRQGLSRTHRTG